MEPPVRPQRQDPKLSGRRADAARRSAIDPEPATPSLVRRQRTLPNGQHATRKAQHRGPPQNRRPAVPNSTDTDQPLGAQQTPDSKDTSERTWQRSIFAGRFGDSAQDAVV